MAMPLRILIADDNRQYTDLLKSRLELYENVRITGIAHNGSEAFRLLADQEADVLLLDIVMPDIDGLEILQKISQLKRKPIVIIISALGADDITKKALSLGAAYFFHKPLNCEMLISHLRTEILKQTVRENNDTDNALKKSITEILLNMKIPNNLQGFFYLRDIIMLYRKLNYRNQISQLYMEIASAKNTTPQSVQQAIRYAIKIAYDNFDAGAKPMPAEIFNRKPNNLNFIKSVAALIG